jgi:hypothetical protein
MAEVGEGDSGNPVAVGSYAFFQVYTGSLGFWTYEGNSPFMGLQNLPAFREFAGEFAWPELRMVLDEVQSSLQQFSAEQLSLYAKFQLDSVSHTQIDQVTFPQALTDLVTSDFHENEACMFQKACEYLERTVEFLVFEDRAALNAWSESQG